MAGTVGASGDRSVAAGRDIRSVHTGDRVTVLPAEALTVSPAAGLVHLPERTQLFVGRARELALLDEASGIQVICGLGGIGKSTLAARWAADRVADHTVVWWITAETSAELDAGLADLARAMQPGVVGVLPEDALRERALQWLATHDDWLLVLDNVSTPADLRPLLARVGGGRIVVTSRRSSGWQDIARTVVLDVLGPAEAAELFTGVCEAGDGLDPLCAELGYLPLALKQAAAYCAEAGITPRAYLELLAAYPAEMFAAAAEGGEAGRTVARVWQVTLDRLRDTPLAGRILGVLAWWAPEGIPRRLLDPLGTPLEVTEAVRRLRAHSMITLAGTAIGVHRTVQAVVRAGDGGEGRETAGKLLLWVARGSGDLFANIDMWRPYAIQALALARYTDPDEDTGGPCLLFNWAAFVLGLTTDGRSLALHARALRGYRRLYGAEDERSLNALGGLVLGMQQHGVPTEPAGLHEEHFDLNVRLYGPDHPRTIAARGHLAKTLMRSSRHRAEELLRENVDRAVRSLGEDDRETLGARRALLFADPDRLAACSGLELLLARSREVLPEGDDLIHDIAASLTTVLLELGRTERALELTWAAVGGVSARHGRNHPQTLMRRGFHVHALIEAGEIDRARPLAKELLDDCESTLSGTLLTAMVRRLACERLSLSD
ncbi:NB-ARC domain-containing protein [Streptomyces sp. NPDC050842]|uniref:NB-ARC domain-containing protein n=1 Tax=Streptomyces sp. NPDC050842 TaxID=3365636 RepID=UPI0037B78DA8